MLVDTAELLERLKRIREEVAAIEKLLREAGAGATKAEARKVNDMQETLNGLEAQLMTGKEKAG